MSNSLRRLRPRFETLEAREVLASYMAVSLHATDLAGNQITSVAAGQAFNLQVWVDDLRPTVFGTPANHSSGDEYSNTPYGVFSAYVDLIYNGSAFNFDSLTGPSAGPGSPSIVNVAYNELKSTDGRIEELGAYAISQTPVVNGSERLWITIPMIAESNTGQFTFSAVNTLDNEGLTDNAKIRSWNNNYLNALELSGPTPLNPNEVDYTGAEITLNVVEAGAPVDIDLRIVRTPTAVNSTGEVSTLPQNAVWLDEWDRFYVEIYATAPEGAALKSVTVSIDFTNNFHNAIQVIGAGQDSSLKFAASNTSFSSNTSRVSATFSTALSGIGDNDTPALLGRIYFGPDTKPGSGVDYATSTGYAQPDITDFRVTVGGATVQYSGSTGTTGVSIGSSTATNLWAVPYDLDDDGSITLVDLTQVIRKIGTTVTPANNLYGLDFTHNGVIDLTDVSMLIKNIGIGVTQLSPRKYYTGFPFESAPALMGFIEGESVGGSMLLEGESVSPAATSAASAPASTSVWTPTYYPLVLTESSTSLTSTSSATEAEEESPSEEIVPTNFVSNGSDLQTMLIINAAENSSSEDLSTDSEAVDELFADLDNADLHLTM